MDGMSLHLGDCLDVLRTLPSASIDAVVTDPPYPCIKREYGYWTEAEWFALMNPVVDECRRVLKPTGSAVFVLQPNSERVGRMRTWLWDFMAKWGREWGIVQDAWWWNSEALPTVHANRNRGLMRPSVKGLAWLGLPGCYRDQSAVLVPLVAKRRPPRGNALRYSPSGGSKRDARMENTAIERGGTTPANLLRLGHDGKAGDNPHPGRTPLALCRWWVRYICPPGGTVLDPFLGSGTVGLAALAEGRDIVGIERVEKYFAIAQRRIHEAASAGPLFDRLAEPVCPVPRE